MRYVRLIFVVITVVWTFGAVAALMDSKIQGSAEKLAVLITFTACWGVVASWNHVWREK